LQYKIQNTDSRTALWESMNLCWCRCFQSWTSRSTAEMNPSTMQVPYV
jgi:hypothetical protein